MHDRNKHLGSIVVKPQSGRKVWWSCPDCPDGHSHIWEATVANRTTGSGCPFCSGAKVCKHNSLATNVEVHLTGTETGTYLCFQTLSQQEALSEHTGAAQLAGMTGRPYFRCELYEDAQSVQTHTLAPARMASGRSIPPLPAATIPCWLSGIMTSMQGRGTTLTTPRSAARSSLGGIAINAPKARNMSGKPSRFSERAQHTAAALSVLGKECVPATLCRPFTLRLLLTLTRKLTN